MIQMVFFIECNSSDMAEDIAKSILNSVNTFLGEIELQSIEEYEKFDGWYRIAYNVSCMVSISFENANEFLKHISNTWEWNGNKSSAHSCSRTMKAKFADERIKFVTCRFGDLEIQNKRNIK